jgi:hypothetical protein
MVDGVNQEVVETEVEESGVKGTMLGGREFRGAVEHREPGAPELKPAPEGIPEKFWDPIKGELRSADLIKSYTELEKRIGAPKEEASEEEVAKEETEETAEETEEASKEETSEETEEETEGEKPQLNDAIQAAQAAYAETGELSAEAREPLKAAGITDEQIDFYLAGVKATEAALTSAAHKAAGSEEAFKAAVQWAASGGLSEKQIIAFNAQTGDVETVGPAVAGLMAAFRAANPGEGRLTNRTTGHSTGDVYTHMDEFTQDLDRADQQRDKVARRKAIDKLRRSREAGTVKSERRSPFGG